MASAHLAVCPVHPFPVALEEAHHPKMEQHSAFWEVQQEALGALDHSQRGLPAVVDHRPQNHQQLNQNHWRQMEAS